MQFQKHLGVYLDNKLAFRDHLRNVFKKVSRKISLLRKLQNDLARAPLVTIQKNFIFNFKERPRFSFKVQC